jgi:hypothetical protein
VSVSQGMYLVSQPIISKTTDVMNKPITSFDFLKRLMAAQAITEPQSNWRPLREGLTQRREGAKENENA